MLALAQAGDARAPAHAHGFGERYELPLPLGLYLFGAAAVVAFSFLLFGWFLRGSAPALAASRRDLLSGPVGRMLAQPLVMLAVRLAALALFVLTLLAGFLGDQNPYRNIAPTLVWIIFWVGLAYVSAFAGDLWALVNPWRTAFDGAQWLYRHLGGRWLGLRLAFPPRLGVWPACLLLLLFAYVELIYPEAASPFHIAALATGYSALTWAGMLAFGRDEWLRHGEVFSLVFGTFARFAPTQAEDGRLLLRPFGAGLTGGAAVSVSMMALVLLLLSNVLYDGFVGTGEWELLESTLRAQLPAMGAISVRSVGLVLFWGAFLAAYLGICSIMSRVGGGTPATLEVARAFALTLVPIAIGYHVAHYLVFLLIQGQYIIPLLSDPFGRGWNLFGTANYRVDIAFVGARFSWYVALGAIVGGHLLAVYLAHRRALIVFTPAKVATATQAPLTALMVVYTFVGLSIMAEPIVESRTSAAPGLAEAVAIPADALLPIPPSGKLERVAPGTFARRKLTYKVLGSAFHDGSKTAAADLLYAYAFVYRWSTPSDGAHYDPLVDAASASLRRQLAGVRIAGVDASSKSFRVGDVNFVREVFTVEVYLSSTPGDPDASALIAPWSTLPWPVLVLMEEAVTRGWAAFSQAEAARRNVPWLDLVRSAETNAKLATLVAEFEREAFRPSALTTLVTPEEARERWRALAAFFKASGHFLVTNGPYRLKSWTPQSVTVEAFRDLSYPLGVGSYDGYAIPRRAFITDIDWNGELLAVSADIEVVEKFQRSYRLVRTALKSVPATIASRSAPELRYVFTSAQGQVALAGIALPGPDARFQVNVKDRLPAGVYTLAALVAVTGNVMNAEVRRLEIVIPSAR